MSPSMMARGRLQISCTRSSAFRWLLQKLSRMATSSPAFRSSTQACDPIYPAPPVTKIIRQSSIFRKTLTQRMLVNTGKSVPQYAQIATLRRGAIFPVVDRRLGENERLSIEFQYNGGDIAGPKNAGRSPEESKTFAPQKPPS